MHWSEEDDMEVLYRCKNDLLVGRVAKDGDIFVLKLEKLE
jgi:hypothetical protein